MKDCANHILVKRAISPVSVADNTAVVGQIIDRQGFQSLTLLLALGAIGDADATFAVLLEESDAPDMAGANAVADEDMISQAPGVAPETAAAFKFDSDDQVRKLGYVGNKRYTRLTVTPTSNASPALIAALALLAHPERSPVEQTAA